MADALFRLGKIRQALALARRAARQHVGLAGPHRVIGKYHLRMRDRSAALRQFKAFMRKVGKDGAEAPFRPWVRAMVRRLSD